MYANPVVNFFSRFYNCFVCAGTNLQSIFLLLIRIIWGHQFMVTGFGKLTHINNVAQYFASLGLVYPEYLAWFVGAVELFFGTLLLIGLASRIAGLVLAITMISAYGFAHTHVFTNLHFLMDPTVLIHEAPFPFLMTALIVFLFGPGRLSVDAWIKRRSQHWNQY